MSELNLEVKLIATPWLAPSILDQYVKEVQNPDPTNVYGRQKVGDQIEWVPVPSPDCSNYFFYGASSVNPITASEISNFSSASYSITTGAAEVEVTVIEPGYVWFCSVAEVDGVVVESGLNYIQPITKQSDPVVVSMVAGNVLQNTALNCYYTSERLIAGTYKFKVIQKRGSI